MKTLMSFDELSRALGTSQQSFRRTRLFTGEGKQDPVGFANRGFSSVSIDSRNTLPGALFVALKGAAHDGHRFVEAAFKAGASGAMVACSALENPEFGLTALAQRFNKVLIAVPDTLKGLQNAAAAYLKQFSNLLRVGITGSSGKTTTKEIAAAIIGQEKQVVMNKGNLNSETGLPLSVFDVRAHHEVGIFEAGMNRRGEIAELAAVLNPCVALITNVGSAHIGILGSREAIAEEKKKIFSEFTGSNIALIPEHDDYRDFLAEGVRGKVSFYGEKSFPGFGGMRNLGLDGTEILWDGQRIRFALPGRHIMGDVSAAIAIAREIPVSAEAIRKGLESVKPMFGRGEILRGRTTVIRDCINANPESLAGSIEFCESLDWPGRRVYVIGEMLELGENSRKAHERIGALLSKSKADMVYFYGKETAISAEVFNTAVETGAVSGAEAAAVKNASRCFHTSDMEELSRSLDAYVRSGDLVLLKGSKGCALWKLSGILTGNKADEAVSRLSYNEVS